MKAPFSSWSDLLIVQKTWFAMIQFATVDETPDPALSSVKYNEQLTKAPCMLCLMLSALALHYQYSTQ